MIEFFQRFLDNYANPPEPGPELVPTRWRIPFFLGLAALSLLLLVLVVRYVVIPGVNAQRAATPASSISSSP